MSITATEARLKIVRYLLFVTVAVSIVLGLVLGVNGRKSKAAAINGGYLHTDGNKILDENNQQIRIMGVNWFGFETSTYCPHGLWARNWRDMLDQIKNLGFNTLRLPYCNQMFDAGSTPNSFDINLNPDLQGLTALQIMDKIIDYCGQIGLRVFLDRHRPDSASQSPLWYTAQYSEQRWINDWVMLADRYKDNPVVFGADAHNEPNGPATWGDGNMSTDWKAAAERVGNAIHRVNPNWLIIVEGISSYNGFTTWWGAQLAGVRDAPVRLSVDNKVVYSPHDYCQSVFPQTWFSSPNYPNNLISDVWRPTWGFIHEGNIAPILVGEYGSKLQTQNDQQWLQTLVGYLGTGVNGKHSTFWTLTPNSADTGGLLNGDYSTIDIFKYNMLVPILSQPF